MNRKPKANAVVDRSPEANCNRLLALARLLRGLPAKQFDMGFWVFKANRKKKAMQSCGTICCVAGWATSVHPDLELLWDAVHNKHTGKTGADALETAFGIDSKTALFLVDADSPHQKPRQAAAAVEKVAKSFAQQHNLSIRYE